MTGRSAGPAADVAAARNALGHANALYGPVRGRPGRSRRRRRATPADRLRGLVIHYGWRAYAIPVLAVVTVFALMTSTTASHHAPKTDPAVAAGARQPAAAPLVAPSQIALKDDAPGDDAVKTVPSSSALPEGAAYARHGAGTFRVLPGTSPAVGNGPLHRYSIDVERGVNDIDLAHYQRLVVQALSDPRSWSGHGVSLQRVDSGQIDFHVTLTSSFTVRSLCGYTIPVETSCYAQAGSVDGLSVDRVVFNDARWARGSTAYLGDLDAYRIYMINHEDGHALGHEHAHQCLPGGLAPVMMQQTFGLKSALSKKICQANPWPYPTGPNGRVVKGAPGAEQQDTDANDEYNLGD